MILMFLGKKLECVTSINSIDVIFFYIFYNSKNKEDLSDENIKLYLMSKKYNL
jgi:hypothetical protein